jgi:hypothetical protein
MGLKQHHAHRPPHPQPAAAALLRSAAPRRAAPPLPLRRQFKAALGGQCQAIISGGAPLSPHVQEFVQVAMSCPVIQVIHLGPALPPAGARRGGGRARGGRASHHTLEEPRAR